jgi:hypothetical protein
VGEDDLGVFAGFKGEESNGAGEFVKDVFLDDAGDELVYLVRRAVNFCGMSMVVPR